MKRRIFIRPLTTFAIAAAMILLMGLATFSYADGGTQGNIKWNYNESTKTLTVGLVSTSVDSSEKELAYGFIDMPWHKYKYDIETVVISEGVTEIGGETFRDHHALTTVKLPESVKVITDLAFAFLKGLETVYHPTGDCEILCGVDEDDYEYDPFAGCYDSVLTFEIPGDTDRTSWMAGYCIRNGFRIKGQPGSLIGAYIPEKYAGDEPLEEEPDRGYWYFERVKWNGKVQKPVPTVMLYGQKLYYGEDFTCSYPKSSDVGQHIVYIKGIGDYCDETLSYYVIYPKGTSISKLTAGTKKLTVKWLKQDKKMSHSKIDGYQVQVATNKSFTKNVKEKTIKGYKNITKTITGLKSKKTYYVRVRTYKDAGLPEDIYSTWSPVKKIKVK